MRRRDRIRGLLGDADDPLHGHARRVMHSYEEEWLAGQPVLLAILHCVGLFDRPANGDCLKALRAKPPIRGLTDEILSSANCLAAKHCAAARGARPCAGRPPDPDALDAHPLVREWFGDRLKATNEAAWKPRKPPLRPSAPLDLREANADSGRACSTLSRRRPWLSRRALSAGARRSLRAPHYSAPPQRAN